MRNKNSRLIFCLLTPFKSPDTTVIMRYRFICTASLGLDKAAVCSHSHGRWLARLLVVIVVVSPSFKREGR